MVNFKKEYDSGKTIKQIAEEQGATYSAVRWRLQKQGTKFREHGGVWKDLPTDEIRKSFREGATIYFLAKKYGVSRTTIKARLSFDPKNR